ncbi:YtrH family sporulation protein [Tuberibacillus sp. Marseille-P3662]|uniref:YtrH family sporulation protein n=1 Tax=Tuberibacillus sp. Marseille-P3662 TaxID=1965358 RepID=UPI000A1CAC01|nr:YtrH family sporulation protein [Tuberibacillus sp. Marseille-P3662]
MDFRQFAELAIAYFFIALGVMIGGCLIGTIAFFMTSQPPLTEMSKLAGKLKIWAIVAAIGGTFDTIRELEQGFLDGTPLEVVKHILLITCAMSGAHTGMIIIQWFTQEVAQ